MIEQGFLIGVVEDVDGSSAASDHPSGATTLDLIDAGDFSEDGGTCRVVVDEGSIYDIAYTLAEDSDTLALATPLPVDVPEGSPVHALTVGGDVSLTISAEVELGDGEDDNAVVAEIAPALVPFFPLSMELDGAVVDLESNDYGWTVVSVPRRDFAADYTMTPEGPAETTQMPLPDGLTITVGVEVIKVVWSGSAASAIPPEFGRLAVHVSKVTGYTPTQGTEVATVSSPYGGTALYSADGGETYYVRCAIASLRGDYGDFTAEVAVTPLEAASADIFEGAVVAESLAIGQTATGSFDQTFSGTSFPAGWSVVGNEAAVYAEVADTGPTGQDGSAIHIEYGPAGVTTDPPGGGTGYVLSEMTDAANVDLRARVLVALPRVEIEAGVYELARLAIRHADLVGNIANDQIAVDLIPSAPDGVSTLKWSYRVISKLDGTDTVLGFITTATDPTTTWHWVRLRVAGSAVMAKVWPDDGSSEPDWEVVESGGVIAAGGVALTWLQYISGFGHETRGQDVWVDQMTADSSGGGLVVLPDGSTQVNTLMLPTADGTSTSVSGVTATVEVFDGAGASLGYIPIYSSRA